MFEQTLKSTIADANKTQDEISKKCKEMGTPISRGYLNNVLNGNGKILEEDVSRNIARICNADERILVLEGYLEKAPHEFIDFLNKLQNSSLEIGLALLGMEADEETKNLLINIYRKEKLSDIIIGILDMNNILPNMQELLNLKSDNTDIKSFYNELLYFTMNDNSMQDKIPKGSKLRLETKSKCTNGDIALIEINGEKLIRMIIFLGKDIFIAPLNKEYKSQIIKNGEYKILAKVRSIEIPL